MLHIIALVLLAVVVHLVLSVVALAVVDHRSVYPRVLRSVFGSNKHVLSVFTIATAVLALMALLSIPLGVSPSLGVLSANVDPRQLLNRRP